MSPPKFILTPNGIVFGGHGRVMRVSPSLSIVSLSSVSLSHCPPWSEHVKFIKFVTHFCCFAVIIVLTTQSKGNISMFSLGILFQFVLNCSVCTCICLLGLHLQIPTKSVA